MDYKNYDDLYKLRVVKNLSSRKIGKLLGVSASTIDNWLAKFNIPKPKIVRVKQEDNINIQDVLNLIASGYLLKDIATTYNVDRNVIKRLVGSHGYNFKNHRNQTAAQSMRMITECNPTKNTKRPQNTIDKMLATRRANNIERWKNISDYKTYSKVCRQLSHSYYGSKGMVPSGYVIDHVFSVKDCWENKVPPHLASNPNNLRIISVEENLKKGANSLISYAEFLSKVSPSTTIESAH